MDDQANRTTGRKRRPRLHDIGADPDYRYSLANERTFLSWIRTALALLAGGVAVVQFAPDLGPRALRLVIGVGLIVISGLIAGAAHHQWVTRERAMRENRTLPHSQLIALLGYGLATVAVVMLVVLVTANSGQ